MEEQKQSEESTPQPKKNRSWIPLAILIAVVAVVALVILVLPKAEPPVGNVTDSHGCQTSAGYVWCDAGQKCIRPFEENCTQPINITQRVDVGEELCAQLTQAATEANITTTRYYFQAPYCIWEIANYSEEFTVYCENENNTLNVKLRPRNMTIDVVKSRFPECNVTQTI